MDAVAPTSAVRRIQFALASPFTLNNIIVIPPLTTLWKYDLKDTTLAHRFLVLLYYNAVINRCQ